MRQASTCPHCGRTLLTAEDSDLVAVLRREIADLQATVARLRGTGLRYVPAPERRDVEPVPEPR